MEKYEISEEYLRDFLANNESRIFSRINKIVSSNREKTVLLAMDFDECAIEENLSKLVTNHYWDRGVINEKAFVEFSIENIATLFNCYVDLSEKEFHEQIEYFVGKINWKPTFISFIKEITSKDYILPVFISSGMTIAAKKAMESIGYLNFPVVADEILIENGIVQGPYTVIGEDLKGIIIKKFKDFGNFMTVITVGHSSGDVKLIEGGSKGYRFSLEDDPKAMEIADKVVKKWEDILPSLP